MLYRPLFWTAFWFEDWLHEFLYRGATAVLLSSASAKTAFCLAYLIKKRASLATEIRLIGLTSQRNLDFTRGLGLYDEILDYDSIESAESLRSAGATWLYIDVAGHDALNERVRACLTPRLKAIVQLGLTNLSPSAPTAATTKFTTNTTLDNRSRLEAGDGPETEQFFMPEWLAARRRQLSIAQITTMQAKAWHDLMRDGKDWVKIERVYGGPAVDSAYRAIAANGTDPTSGMIWSLWDSPELGRQVESKL